MRGSVKGYRLAEWLWGGTLACLATVAGVIAVAAPLDTTRKNFFIAGTQAGEASAPGFDPLVSPQTCSFCHADYNEEQAPFNRWAHSVMGQSGRDPVFHAALAIAEQDASFVGEFCLRCHVPTAFAKGQVRFDSNPNSPTYGKHLGLSNAQLEGVSCSVCHRMVDPIYTPGQSPSVDQAILATILPGPQVDPHNAGYILDPQDRRRGPFDLDADWTASYGFPFPGYHDWLQSPFHESSRMCATCHDVSTPHFTKQANGSFALNASNQQPSDKSQQFPEQRTYSEWAGSMFAQGPVNLSGRFGGNRMAVSSCQDCHMPTTEGEACALNPPVRPQLPKHEFAGANTWILRAVDALYPGSETGLNESGINEAIDRTRQMLASASDTELVQLSGRINVRIVNYSGHKLPTGYTEGRRMWINVKFKDGAGNVLREHGAYDSASATLTDTDTKVYEGVLGLDATVAALTGNQPGPGFRLALANKKFKDNRIPPMGFRNSTFEASGAGHVPTNQYVDGQYWDDTPFAIPLGARRAEVKVYYQSTSKEYIEFLRDANTSDNRGQVAYDQWLAQGKSAPALMDDVSIALSCKCDVNRNGETSAQDIFDFLSLWFIGQADFDADGTTDVRDIFAFLDCWFARCVGY